MFRSACNALFNLNSILVEYDRKIPLTPLEANSVKVFLPTGKNGMNLHTIKQRAMTFAVIFDEDTEL